MVRYIKHRRFRVEPPSPTLQPARAPAGADRSSIRCATNRTGRPETRQKLVAPSHRNGQTSTRALEERSPRKDKTMGHDLLMGVFAYSQVISFAAEMMPPVTVARCDSFASPGEGGVRGLTCPDQNAQNPDQI